MPLSSKRPHSVTFGVAVAPSGPIDSNFTLFSLRDALTGGPLTASQAHDLLRLQLSVLVSLRKECARQAHAFEESFRSQTSIAHLQPSARPVTFDNDIRPSVRSLPPGPAENRNAQGQFKPVSTMKPHKRAQSEPTFEPSRSMTSTTIWTNVNKFFAITPTVEKFRQWLSPAELPDTAIQLGPHYSVSINQKLKQKFRNGNVQLRLPPELVETPEQMEISPTVMFHRLLSSFVGCDEEVVRPRKVHKVAMNLTVPVFSQNMFPSNHPGTTPYSLLPFEQKLMNEVRSLGLTPDGSGPKLTDNEVMNEIMEKSHALGELMRETNALRREMMEELVRKERRLKERAEMAKKWAMIPVKQEQSQKKDQKRAKKRDKL